MRKMAEHLGRFIDKLTDKTGFIVCFAILPIIAIITYEVVIRYVFHQPTLWAHETTQFVFAVYIAFGGAYALAHGAHIRVDIFYNMFSPRLRQVAAIVIFVVSMAFSIVIVWQFWGMTQSSVSNWERSWTIWAPPLYPVKILVLLAVILLAIQGMVTFVREVRRAKHLDSNSGVIK